MKRICIEYIELFYNRKRRHRSLGYLVWLTKDKKPVYEGDEMDYNYVQEFIKLVETKSFSEVANYFYTTQPTISRHVKMLEDELEILLVERTTHSVQITDAGWKTYERFKEIIAQHEQLKKELNELKREKKGELHIGVLYYGINEFVRPYVNKFVREYPGIKVVYHPCEDHQIYEWMENHTIDLGLTSDLNPDHKEYIFKPIATETLKCIVLDTHPWADRSSVSLDELKNERMFRLSPEKVDYSLWGEKLKYKELIDGPQLDLLPYAMEHERGFYLGMDSLKNMKIPNWRFLDIEPDILKFHFGYIYASNNNSDILGTFIKYL